MATRVDRPDNLLRLTVTVSTEAEEAAGAILEQLFQQWPAAYTEPESNLSELSLYFRREHRPSRSQWTDLNQQLRGLRDLGLGTVQPRVRMTALADRNWRESWKRHFKPLEIGQRLLLRPSWSRRRARPGQSVVVLDPGLSFGTGQHPTTSFCLEELVRARSSLTRPSLLDIGTGSGILAIAAAKLGYKPVQGFDHDPEAVRVASGNARRNRVASGIRFRKQDLRKLPDNTRNKYDVVCANLLADLLTTHAAVIRNRVKPGGMLIIAGILDNEYVELENRFLALGARPMRSRKKRGWRSGSYQFPA